MLLVAVITLIADQSSDNIASGSLKMVKSSIIYASEEDYVEDKYHLTHCEKVILKYLVKGLQYKEIANTLYISIETVKSHVRNIYSKMDINNRSEATIEYLKFF